MKKLLFILLTFSISHICLGQFSTFFNSGTYEELFEISASDCDPQNDFFAGIQFSINGNINADKLFIGSYIKASGMVNNPILSYPNGNPTYFNIHNNVEMEVIYDNGVCNGYLIAISVSESSNSAFSIHLIRIDASGNLLWVKNPFMNQGNDAFINEIIQDSNGDMLLVGSKINSGDQGILVLRLDPNSGSISKANNFRISLFGQGDYNNAYGNDIIELGFTNTDAEYAIVGRVGNFSHILLLDNNLNLIANEYYDLDSDPSTWEEAKAIEFDGSTFWISGTASTKDNFGNQPRYSYLINLNGIAGFVPFLDLTWGAGYDLQSNGNIITDMELSPSGNSVVLTGFSNIHEEDPGGYIGDAFLMDVSNGGAISWAKRYNSNTDQAGIHDLELYDNKYFAAGDYWLDFTNVDLHNMILSASSNGDNQEGCFEDIQASSFPLSPFLEGTEPNRRTENRNLQDLNYTFSTYNINQQSCGTNQGGGCESYIQDCLAASLNISTGFDEDNNTFLPINNQDNQWILTSSPDPALTNLPSPAFVISTHPAWSATTPNSQWISAYPFSGYTTNSNVPFVFEYTFCLCEESEVILDFLCSVDDELDLDLFDDNSNKIADIDNIPSGGGTSFWNQHSSTYGNVLAAGTYIIKAQIINTGSTAMGLNIEGSITANTIVKSNCCVDDYYISGLKFEDLNCNGVLNSESEDGVANWPITIFDQNGNPVWNGNTDGRGLYSVQLPAGTYTVVEGNQNGWAQTYPANGSYTITIDSNNPVGTAIFGNNNPESCACNEMIFNQLDDCCGHITLNNPYPNYFDEIELEVSSGSFTQTTVNNTLWTSSSNSNNSILNFSPASASSLQTGYLTLLNFCVDDYQLGTSITLRWKKNGDVICSDNFEMNCECPEDIGYLEFDAEIKIQNNLVVGLLDAATDVIQDADGNFVYTGITQLSNNNQLKPYVLKLDNSGNLIAGPLYFDNPGVEFNLLFDNSIKIQENFLSGFPIGYILAINQGASGQNYIQVLRLDQNLNIVCELEIKPNSGQYIFNDFVLSNNELFLIGTQGGSGSSLMLFKVSTSAMCSAGSSPFPGPLYDSVLYPNLGEGKSICTLSDGSFGISGKTTSGSNLYFANIDPSLNLKNIGGSSNNWIEFDVNSAGKIDHPVAIAQLANSNILIGGTQGFDDNYFLVEVDYTSSPNSASHQAIILNTFGAAEEMKDMLVKGDGNIAILGTKSTTSTIHHSNLIVLDPMYSNLSAVSYFNPTYPNSNAAAFHICDDNGFIIAQNGVSPACMGFNLGCTDSKFTKTGPLGYLTGCNCYASSNVEIIIEPQVGQANVHPSEVFNIGFGSHSQIGTINLEHHDNYCSQGEGISPTSCDAQTTLTTMQMPGDSCCQNTLTIFNNSTDTYKVEVEILNPTTAFFDAANVLPAFCFTPGSFTANSFVVEMCNGQSISTGTPIDFVEFCLADSSTISNNQQFKITYISQSGQPIPDCMDTLSATCELGPFDEDCYDLVIDNINCDTIPGLYTICFTLTNHNILSGLASVDLSSPGIAFLPANVVLTTPLSVGNSTQICVDIYDLSNLPLPRMIQINHSAHDVNYEYCCTDLDSTFVLLEKCCDPCLSPWVSVSPDNLYADSCCYALDIQVDCPESLSKIGIESLTPGVDIGSIFLGGQYSGLWTISGFGNQYATFDPQNTTAMPGFYDDLIHFCLDDSLGSPIQEIAVHYFEIDLNGQETIVCSDTLDFICSQDISCLEIVDHEVYCDDNGNYFLDFTIRNTSVPAFTADKLVINTVVPNPDGLSIAQSVFMPINLPVNTLFSSISQILKNLINTPIPGDQITLDFMLHDTTVNGVDTCCQESVKLTITIPPCANCCVDEALWANGISTNSITYGICDTAFVCVSQLDSCTYTDINWGDGSFESQSGSFSVTHGYTTPGTYIICSDYKESNDGGQSFCWDYEICDTIMIQNCPDNSLICDSIPFDTLSYLGWSAATCYSGSNPGSYVFGLIDTRNNASAPLANNWGPPFVGSPPSGAPAPPTMIHGINGNSWNNTNLGEIFGLAVDPYGNIFTSAFSLYSNENYGMSGYPSIFKINGFTGVITNLNSTLPQTFNTDPNYNNQSPAFGNLCYNYKNNLVYVSNLEDGIIYGLNANTGAVQTTFDYGSPDLSPGFAPLGDRIFGVGYNHVEDRVYFCVWKIDKGTGAIPATSNEIWSIALDQSGFFVGSESYEFSLPYFAYYAQYSNPVSDISFDATGRKMLLSERTVFIHPFNKRLETLAHEGRSLEYISANTSAPFTGSYIAEPISKFGTRNSSGGNDYMYGDSTLILCDSAVVFSEDAMSVSVSSNNVYGLRGCKASGGNVMQSWWLDLDGDLIYQDKTQIGDVEVFRNLCCDLGVSATSCNDLDWNGFDIIPDTICVGNQFPNVYWKPTLGSLIPDWIEYDIGCNLIIDHSEIGPNYSGLTQSNISNPNMLLCVYGYKIVNGDTCKYTIIRDLYLDYCPIECCVDEILFQNTVAGTSISMLNTTEVQVSNYDLNACQRVSIDWGDGNNTQNIPSAYLPVNHIYSSPGIYNISVTIYEEDEFGVICFSQTINQIVSKNENTFIKDDIKLYPNPFNNKIQIERSSSYSEDLLLELYNINGLKILIDQFERKESRKILNLINLPDGIYFITFRDSFGNQKSKKIVKITN